jgi:DNA ligase-1
MPATLAQFATLSDSVASTSSKLKKQSLLAEYLAALDNDHDLRLAVRYLAGKVFPATDSRTLNIGGATAWDVSVSVLEIDARQFHDLVVQSGEIGEALSRAWNNSPRAAPELLTLADLDAAFSRMAATGVVARKKLLLEALLRRCTSGREAAYLMKTIFGEPRTGVQEGILQAAIALAFGKTPAEIQRTQLLLGDLEEVAILARRNELASARFKLFHPIQFMLAAAQEDAAQAAKTMAGKAFLAEDKLDGIRAQVHKDDQRVAIYTRTLSRADAAFPDVIEAIRKVPGEFLLDGEIVPYRDSAVLPFAHMQRRLGRKQLTAEVLDDNPAVFIAFDVFYSDGRLLMDEPLNIRREELARIAVRSALQQDESAAAAPLLLISAALPVASVAEIESAFAAAKSRRNEGVVLKDPESIYAPGLRGQAWLKLKTHLPTLDCVVTAAEYGHGKRRDVLSDYTFAVWDRPPQDQGAALANVGKAYTGLTDEEIAQLTELFLKLSVAKRGRVHAVRPQVVLEIACDQIQKSARHASGYAMRFPRIKRIRWDKRPQDADTLQRVQEVYASTSNTSYAARPIGKPPSKAGPTLFDGLE